MAQFVSRLLKQRHQVLTSTFKARSVSTEVHLENSERLSGYEDIVLRIL
jgi:hypothetical protein